jgi:transposase
MRLSLSCKKCGGKELTIPDEATDDSSVTCSNCGAEHARWGDLKSAIHEAAREKI